MALSFPTSFFQKTAKQKKNTRLTQFVKSIRLSIGQLSLGIPKPKMSIAPLNQVERKLFLILYTGESLMTYQEISEKAELSVSVIPECISSLIKKGVPLQRSFFNEQIFLRLEPQFKELQAKENLINLSLQSFLE